MIQYGGPIRDGKGDRYGVLREGSVVVVEMQTGASQPILRLQGYPALLQFIARLSEAAKDMANANGGPRT